MIMTESPAILDLTNAALIVIDMQNDSLPNGFYAVPTMANVVENCRKTIAACRRAGIPIISTQHTYRADGSNTVIGEPKDETGRPLAYVEGTWGWQFIDGLTPEPGDLVIPKTRWSAFCQTDLDAILRARAIRRLIICGVVTDGCVMTTVFDAFFNDYRVVLVHDACGAAAEGCHQAAIVTMANWVYELTLISADDLGRALAGEPCVATVYRQPNEYPFSPDDLRTQFERAIRGHPVRVLRPTPATR